jgi:hypothetical protein
MTLHKDLRVMFGEKVAVVVDVSQDDKYARVRYKADVQGLPTDATQWVLSSLLRPFSAEETLLPRPIIHGREAS